MSGRPHQTRSLTAIDGAMVLIVVLLIVQIWLLSSTLESYLDRREPLPLIVDDVLVQFDDARAVATLRTLAELSRRTQVLIFTHHDHLVRLAEAEVDSAILFNGIMVVSGFGGQVQRSADEILDRADWTLSRTENFAEKSVVATPGSRPIARYTSSPSWGTGYWLWTSIPRGILLKGLASYQTSSKLRCLMCSTAQRKLPRLLSPKYALTSTLPPQIFACQTWS